MTAIRQQRRIITSPQVRMFLMWINELARWDEPLNGRALSEALQNHDLTMRLQTQATWDRFHRFLVSFVTEYGTYGRDMRPSYQTVADDFNMSRRTVQRWLTAAVRLGILAKVADSHSDGFTPVFQIAPFWERWSERADAAGFEAHAALPADAEQAVEAA